MSTESVAERAGRLKQEIDFAAAKKRFLTDGIKDVDAAYKQIVTALERLAQEITAAGVPCEVKSLSERCAVIKGGGVVTVVRWNQQFANTLNDASLSIEFNDKYPDGLPGSGRGHPDAKMLGRDKFTYELAAPEQPIWLGKDNERFSSSDDIAGFILKRFMDYQESLI